MSKTNKVNQEETFNAEQFITDKGGVSKAIRFLHGEGKSRSDIAKMLGKRYQHVRNVLNTPLKKG
jgi:hypothetical protein